MDGKTFFRGEIMRVFKKSLVLTLSALFLLCSGVISRAQGQDYSGQGEDPNKKVLKNALLGAGTGAIASSASGGKAGKGALIGAGTNVIGGALLDSLTGPSQPAQAQYAQAAPQYAQQAPQYSQSSYPVQPVQTQYVQDPGYAPQPVYYQQQPPQENPNTKILKQGLLGAGTGAIASSASGGDAGKGALIGAGTNIIGGALLDTLMTPSQPKPQPVYYQQQPTYSNQYQQSSNQPKKKIIRKYDSDGNVVSEEEVWE